MQKSEFNRYSSDYVQQVKKSISFMRVRQEFFTRVKAGYILELARTHLGDPCKTKIVDVGCGVGLTDQLLCDSVGELHGVDVAGESVVLAQKNVPRGLYRAYDGGKLPYEDQMFDLAFCVNVLHHVLPTQWTALAAEMARVIRIGGIVIVFEHNPLNPLTRLAVFRCKFDRGTNLLGMRTARKILSSQSLRIVDSRYILASPFAGRVWDRIDSVLRAIPAGAQYFVAGKRLNKCINKRRMKV